MMKPDRFRSKRRKKKKKTHIKTPCKNDESGRLSDCSEVLQKSSLVQAASSALLHRLGQGQPRHVLCRAAMISIFKLMLILKYI